MAYTNPSKLARAAIRVITLRVSNGYWPYAYARQAPVGGIRTGDWMLYVTVKNDGRIKLNDKPAYAFEFKCDTEATAIRAAEILHSLFFKAGEVIEQDPRVGKVVPIKDVLKKTRA